MIEWQWKLTHFDFVNDWRFQICWNVQLSLWRSAGTDSVWVWLEPSQRMSRKTSAAWVNFSKVEKDFVQCNICKIIKKASLNSAPLKHCFWITSQPSTINCLQQQDNYYWTHLLWATLKLSCIILEECDIFVQQKLI